MKLPPEASSTRRVGAPRLLVHGGRRLRGHVEVAGARNAALPLLAASLLAEGRSVHHRVPRIADVAILRQALEHLGAEVSEAAEDPHTLQVASESASGHQVPYELVRQLRAALLLLGPLVARHGIARVALPGSAPSGAARPIDQHLKGLRAMGAQIIIEHGDVVVRAPRGRLQGAGITLDVPTVTGTENLMMAATLARGRTTIEQAAREPEVEELAHVLNKMGARIEGAGTSFITIHGVEGLCPIEHAVMPDRIEAGTLLLAAALTRGDVTVRGALIEHLGAVVAKLRSAGATVTALDGGLHVRGPVDLEPIDVATQPYPGFPADLQAQFMVLACLGGGESLITETLFEHRMQHVAELMRLGADIVREGRTAVVQGPRRLSGAPVEAQEPHAVAALVLAGLVAEGTTEVLEVHHLDRGYDGLDRKLATLGAEIRRLPGAEEVDP
jgi:UDP-N-acetylglucosamine 1-carboxyvinyltransferase